MGILDFDDWWFISRLAVFGIGKLVLWRKARFAARANCLNHIKSNKRAEGKAIGICALGRFLGPRPLKVAVNSLTMTKHRKGKFDKTLMIKGKGMRTLDLYLLLLEGTEWAMSDTGSEGGSNSGSEPSWTNLDIDGVGDKVNKEGE